MIFHTKYTISLNRLSRMIETKNPRMLVRFGWVPGGMLRKRFEMFMTEFNEMLNKDEVEYVLENSLLELKISNRVNSLLPALYNGLIYTQDERFKELYKDIFGDYPKTCVY